MPQKKLPLALEAHVGRVRRLVRRGYTRLNLALGRDAKMKIVMFHSGRCGSSVLASLLGQHSDIYWEGEMFHWKRKRAIPGFDRRNFDVFKYIAGSTHRTRRSYGFEIKFRQLEKLKQPLESFPHDLAEMGFTHFIILERRNYLRRKISSLIASETGQYHLRGTVARKLYRVHADPNEILEEIKLLELQYVALYKTTESLNVLRLTYEDDVMDDPRLAYRRACKFLGLEPTLNPCVNHHRTNPFPLKDMLLNYDELKDSLSGTTYAWMLNS